MEQDWFLLSIYQVIKEKELDITPEKIVSLMSEVIQNTLPETATLLLNTLKENSMEMLEEHRLFRIEFEARLQRRWSKPINLLETLIVISREGGEACYNSCIKKVKEEENIVFEVLLKIHARACQISYEILCLLRGGFADGAISRWRTLHELSVLAIFISENNNQVAKMYLDYEYIEKYYEMLEYNQYAARLGYEELSKEEIDNIIGMKDKRVAEYGKEYQKPFDWTMNVLPRMNRNFKGIEKHIQLDYMRPYYKLACNYIHIGPKASSFSLGVIDGCHILLAGASNYGLADPGQNTSLSLTQITTCLLTLYPSYERLMVAEALSHLVQEICEMFVDIQKNIENEEMGESYKN